MKFRKITPINEKSAPDEFLNTEIDLSDSEIEYEIKDKPILLNGDFKREEKIS